MDAAPARRQQLQALHQPHQRTFAHPGKHTGNGDGARQRVWPQYRI